MPILGACLLLTDRTSMIMSNFAVMGDNTSVNKGKGKGRDKDCENIPITIILSKEKFR